jgi:hypothetical protein
MSQSSSGEFGKIYEEILLQFNCLWGTDLTQCTFLNYFLAIMNTNFNGRPWHPWIEVSPMEWYCSERNCIAAVHRCALKHRQSFPAVCHPILHLLLLHGIMCLQHHFLASFSSSFRYQHHIVWYLFQLELIHLLLLQDGIQNQPRLHSSILLTV